MNNKPDYCPEWFDLQNYDICAQYNRRAWWEAITFRKVMCYTRIKEDIDSGINKEFLLDFIKHLSTDGHYSIFESTSDNNSQERDSSITEIGLSEYIDMHELLRTKYPHIFNEISQLPSRLAKIEEMHAYDFGDYHGKWHYYTEDKLFDFNESVYSSFNSLGIPTPYYLHVDLHNNDAQILEDFSNWLKEKRKQINGIEKIKRLSKRDLEKLHEYRVLPYIDLYLWMLLSGENLTYSQLANLLFPDEFQVNIVDRFRNSTKGMAENLLNSSVDLIA